MDKVDNKWLVIFRFLQDFYFKNKHSLVSKDCVLNGINVYKWCNKQRLYYIRHELSNYQIDLLKSIEFYFDEDIHEWFSYYKFVKAYYKKYNTINNMSRDYTIRGLNLDKWLEKQRKNKKDYKLEFSRIQLLDALKIDWMQIEKEWMDSFYLLQDFYNKNGHTLIPKNYKVNNLNVNKWLDIQKKEYFKDNINIKKVALLKSIEFYFDEENHEWFTYYKFAKDFFKEHKDKNIIDEYQDIGLNFFYWINKQENLYRSNKLSSEKIKLLKLINIL